MAAAVVTLSADARHHVNQVRRRGEEDADVVARALKWQHLYGPVLKALVASATMRRAGHLVAHLRASGYGESSVVATCRAIYGEQTSANLARCFRDMASDSQREVADVAELRRLLGAAGVPHSQVTALVGSMDEYDADSGVVDFAEFSKILSGVAKTLRAGAPDDVVAEEEDAGVLGAVAGALTGARASLSALSSAWSDEKLGSLSAAEMRSAGAILNNLTRAGYSDDNARTVCRALFCEKSDRYAQRAYDIMADPLTGRVHLEALRAMVQLMGKQNLPGRPDEAMAAAASSVFADGTIGAPQFVQVLRAIVGRKQAKAEPRGRLQTVREETAPVASREGSTGSTAPSENRKTATAAPQTRVRIAIQKHGSSATDGARPSSRGSSPSRGGVRKACTKDTSHWRVTIQRREPSSLATSGGHASPMRGRSLRLGQTADGADFSASSRCSSACSSASRSSSSGCPSDEITVDPEPSLKCSERSRSKGAKSHGKLRRAPSSACSTADTESGVGLSPTAGADRLDVHAAWAQDSEAVARPDAHKATPAVSSPKQPPGGCQRANALARATSRGVMISRQTKVRTPTPPGKGVVLPASVASFV